MSYRIHRRIVLGINIGYYVLVVSWVDPQRVKDLWSIAPGIDIAMFVLLPLALLMCWLGIGSLDPDQERTSCASPES